MTLLERRRGTKHFRGGAKVHVIDAHWGTCEVVTVIGHHRASGRYAKLDMRVDAGRAPLFDLESDPGEREDLASRRPELVDELRRALQARVRGAPAGELREAPVDDETRANLESLGYVDPEPAPDPPAP